MSAHIISKLLDLGETNSLIEGLYQEAKKIKNLEKPLAFGFLVKDKFDRMIGGLQGYSFYGDHHIDLLWLHPNYRRLGLGRELMQKCEQLGIERHCNFMTVSTMDWEALPFYEKCGFELELTRVGYKENSKNYLLKKLLPILVKTKI